MVTEGNAEQCLRSWSRSSRDIAIFHLEFGKYSSNDKLTSSVISKEEMLAGSQQYPLLTISLSTIGAHVAKLLIANTLNPRNSTNSNCELLNQY